MALVAVVLSAQAEQDLIDIWKGIATENHAAAERVSNSLQKRIETLREFPDRGPLRPQIGKDARILVEGNYLIMYRNDGSQVTIMRVVHGARNIENLLDT